VITFTDQLNEITGTVRAPHRRSMTGAVVVLVPTDYQRARRRHDPTAHANGVGQHGRPVHVPQSLPGDYLIAAIPMDATFDGQDSGSRAWRAPARASLLLIWRQAVPVAHCEPCDESSSRTRRCPRAVLISRRASPAGSPSSRCRLRRRRRRARLRRLRHAAGADAPVAPQQPARDTSFQPTAVGSGSVAGVVTTDESIPRPVRRVLLTLSGGNLRNGRLTVSDDEGRFVFGNLPAGRFMLSGARPGYLTSYYGARRLWRSPGTRSRSSRARR
jgi:hypothetical protein